MRNAILEFNTQFEFEPTIVNRDKLGEHSAYIICGMGGSNLAGDLLEIVSPGIDVYSHRDYGLPALPEERLKRSLIVFSSYSGTTEETLAGYWAAKGKNLPLAAVSAGQKLIDIARRDDMPHIEIPNTKIQPRMAVGFNFLALLKLMGKERELAQAKKEGLALKPRDVEEHGEALAEVLQGKVPVIYASRRNRGLSYNWKIKCNETAKIPAFANVLPELNHNEMTGFDVGESTRALSEKFHFIFLRDPLDEEKIRTRMDVLGKLYRERGLPVTDIELKGKSPFEKVFSSLILADWIALYLGESYGVETEQVPMVEEFKGLIA